MHFGEHLPFHPNRVYDIVMPVNLVAVLIAFCTPLLHAGANVFDSFLSNKIFHRVTTLIFFSASLNVLLLPAIWLVGLPHTLSFNSITLIFLIAAIEVLYQYPYYLAFQSADTSIVASLFSMGNLLTPLLAFLCLGEHLTNYQYFGYFAIIASASLLVVEIRSLRVNHAAWLMLAVSVMLSIESIAYKSIFDQGADWASVVTWSVGIEFLLAVCAMFFADNWHVSAVKNSDIKELGLFFLFAQLLTWGGEQTATFALSLLPTSVVKGIDSTQAIFALLLATLFAKRIPRFFRENLDKEIRKKVLLFVIMIAGTILIVFG